MLNQFNYTLTCLKQQKAKNDQLTLTNKNLEDMLQAAKMRWAEMNQQLNVIQPSRSLK